MSSEHRTNNSSVDSDYTVVDVDAHYLESFENIAEYMDEPWRTRLKESGWGEIGAKQNASSYFPTSTGDRQAYGRIDREHSSYPDEPAEPDEIKASMESIGIDIQLQISHLLLPANAVRSDDQRVTQFMEGYVKYVREHILDPDEGIYGLVPVPFHDVEASLDLLKETEDDEGFIGACMIAAGARPALGNRKYDRIYELGEELDYPFVFHTGGAGLDSYDGFQSFIETHALGFLASNQAQLTSLVMEGIPEKFPELDIIFMESGVTYVPALMTRLDEEYLKRPEENPLLEKLPSDYLKEVYYGTQPLEKSANPEYLETCFNMIGADQIMYASDYPHWDYDRPTTVTDLPFLTEDDKQKILGGNALEVFDL
ncbi:amidohydrolase family protein [Halobellus captivus]|uniref:amidohydrolase family protein n=1 Tax=Halobellus captivus TaxID=2592614 RepID=UPI0011A53EF2|nr:amidohydrolase family protein [Halobellus captivus]